ncbi:MAG TPA: CsbD family protein [Mycobacteriales bacterium]|nr:CsbD family protein [Mycobacteriales bacterium]
MSGMDKAKNLGESAKGKAKEGMGKAVGNESMRAEGKVGKAKGDIKQAGEKLKDAVR